MNSIDVLTAQSVIRSACVSTEQSNTMFNLVVAVFAAMSVELPNAPVSDINEHLMSSKTDINIFKIVSSVNANSNISYDAVRNMAINFYKFRYAMAYGGTESLAFALSAFTGTACELLSPEIKDQLNIVKNDSKINQGFNSAIKLLKKAL
jgi:hypothetical protein